MPPKPGHFPIPAPGVKPESADIKINGHRRGALRKGKWTPEEEDFVSRLIEHFNMGLLMLPEGTTLRAYLADKLNCDPMRITKKFTGSDCLGKRVYQPRKVTNMAAQEMDVARQDLEHLERRFLLRLQRANDADACMLDFDARFVYGDQVVSSPAIDALILQSRGGRWGLMSESDLMSAPSPLVQLLNGGFMAKDGNAPPAVAPLPHGGDQPNHPPRTAAPQPTHPDHAPRQRNQPQPPSLRQQRTTTPTVVLPHMAPGPPSHPTGDQRPLEPSSDHYRARTAPVREEEPPSTSGSVPGPQKQGAIKPKPPSTASKTPPKQRRALEAVQPASTPPTPSDFLIGDEEPPSSNLQVKSDSSVGDISSPPVPHAHEEEVKCAEDISPNLPRPSSYTSEGRVDTEAEAGELVLDFFNSVRHEANSHENLRDAAKAWEEEQRQPTRKRKLRPDDSPGPDHRLRC